MRHRVVRKRLNRDQDHRKALLMNLAQELIKHEKIETTLVKANYVRPFVEKLITQAKEAAEAKDKVRAFNITKGIKAVLSSDEQIRKLISEIAPRFFGINGGYTRTTKIGFRGGDKALLARIELTKKQAVKETKAEVKKEKSEKVAKTVNNEKTGKPQKAEKPEKADKAKLTKVKAEKVIKETNTNEK